ncbi:hypothetical protein [Sutcliffiella horikoshii]
MVLKKLGLCIMFVFVLILAGCWDNKDINHRTMPVVLGITKNQEE